jgi:hypothetical protein
VCVPLINLQGWGCVQLQRIQLQVATLCSEIQCFGYNSTMHNKQDDLCSWPPN